MRGVVTPYIKYATSFSARAVCSALDQNGVEMLVMGGANGGSPQPASCELELFSETARATIPLIEQPNAQISITHNRTIEAMPKTVSQIAFVALVGR